MQNIKSGFGKNLKIIRLSRNLTQEKLAELVDIEQRQLTRIETGKSFPSADTLQNLCIALAVPIQQLFNFDLGETTSDKISLLLADIKKIQKYDKKMEFVELAIKSLENKNAMIKLKNMIEGMLLIQD